MSHISTLFITAGSICMSSCLCLVLRQAGREDGAQMVSLITENLARKPTALAVGGIASSFQKYFKLI